jgi:hypothetical protein
MVRPSRTLRELLTLRRELELSGLLPSLAARFSVLSGLSFRLIGTDPVCVCVYVCFILLLFVLIFDHACVDACCC